jgi:tetratricopeptide (TPR) repeat protein
VVSLLAAALPGGAARAVEPEQIARAVSVQGTVESRRAGQDAWELVKLHDAFSVGDTIRVGPRSRADLALLDRSFLRFDENTTVTLQPMKPERTGVIELLRGAVHFLSRGPSSLDVKTEFVAVGVRGTEFLVVVEDDRAAVTVFEGAVLAGNSLGAVTLSGGQSASAQRGQAPVLQVVARPRDAVRWALHYPSVLRREGAAADTAAVRAQQLLAVGRVDEARAELDRALAAAPGDADALSLQAIIAVVLDDKPRALELARAAVAAAPRSPTPLIALSYAQQARFELEGARSSIEQAVRLAPEDALAWARLAELHASFGDTSRSLEAARRAAAIAPDLSRTQTVLGFAYLRDVETSKALKAFERAIELDSADPLPRLGLGLARIRRGHLDAGAREIEIAASLGPNDAIIRSYLGKAYYEEKRTGLDEREYETAKALDPKDPTPWLYGAIAKQTTNRPVEALRDFERAIELNDGRAVYRSRLLLDSDLAARSASLARIYGDLGFEQLALVEGWKSVESDPTSDAAHRFLADSYAALPRHEVARVSELLQAQLLQPINITPIQPRLAESNLFLVSRGGPGAQSFNEFNPLFDRDQLALQLTGVAGDRSTYGFEPIASGIYRNLSVSVGYSDLKTDGFRVNNDLKDQIATAFVQAELSSQTSVQAEYRYRETDRGDLKSYFFPELVRTALRQTDYLDTYRAGARHAFSPSSILLASVMYQHTEDRADDSSAININGQSDSVSGELQHLFRSRWLDVVSGAGYFKITQQSVLRIPMFAIEQTTEEGGRHANAYAYAHAHLPARLTLTVGLSADRFTTRSDFVPDKDQLNPKLGLVWTPFAGTTLRAAAFRALKRTLITDQTLEPTQVAGFNQFFDESLMTASWRYGVGVDQKVSHGLFAGIEGSRRDLTSPVLDVTGNGFKDVTSKEYEARGYVFWAPLRWLAVRAEYFFDRLVNENASVDATEAKTQRAPLGFGLFLPLGLGATATGTYYRQEGNFQVPSAGPTSEFQRGSSEFWLLDAALTWRLPGRYGLVSLVGTNLLDHKFQFFEQSTANTNLTVQPGRAVFARVTLAGP